MKLNENHPLYHRAIERILHSDFLNFEAFREKTFFISGATGLIGKFFIDVLLSGNLDVKIFALTRDAERARKRFPVFGGNANLIFIERDARDPIPENVRADFIVCGASNTHPVAYANDPMGTIETNIAGAKNAIELSKRNPRSRTLFISSVEIYGNNTAGLESFAETDCGYIDCNTTRACYNEAKRLAECMMQIAHVRSGVDFVSARLSRVFGATMLPDDSKAHAQFLKNALAGEDIVLKSAGTQKFSYISVADAVSALFLLIQKGVSGNAYNVGGDKIRLRDFAEACAECAGTRLVFGEAGTAEKSGFSAAQNALLNDEKIRALGWIPQWTFRQSVAETLEILKS